MKVLLATDGSADAVQAAAFFRRLPHGRPIELTVLTSIFLPAVTATAATGTWLPEFKAQQEQIAAENFRAIEAVFQDTDVTVTTKVVEGHPGHTITDTARAIGVDLVVLGAKGHSAVDRILLGSVSDLVATHAECSVLVVRSPPPQPKQSFTVTIAFDGSQPARLAMDEFSQFAWGEGVKGHVLNVVPIIRTFRKDLLPNVAMQRASERDHAAKAASRQVATLGSLSERIETHVMESEHVGEDIVLFSSEKQSDMIFIGDSGRSAIGRFFLGSVSRYILRHASCSVWIARNKSSDDPGSHESE